MMSTVREKVLEFHRVMGVPSCDVPAVPSSDRVRLRLKLIAEEFFELLHAAVYDGEFNSSDLHAAEDRILRSLEHSKLDVDLPDTADALADLAYVIEGMNIELGINSEKVLDEVHLANMRKTNGPVRADGKKLKPEGWVGPNIHEVLRAQGWRT